MTIAIITEAGVRKVAPLVVSAQQAALTATQAAGIATAVAQGRYYASYAAGNAATTAGQYFAVFSGGNYQFHVNGNATPVFTMPKVDASGNLALVSAADLTLSMTTPKAVGGIILDGTNNAAGITISYSWAAGGQGPLKFSNASGEVARFSASGNFGLGVSPSAKFHAKSSGEIARLETTTARGSGGGYLSFYDPTGAKGYFGYGGANDKLEIVNSLNADMLFYTNNTPRWQILAAGALAPVTDNTVNLGVAATGRIKDTYLVNSPTVTSDATEKEWLGAGFSPAELSAAKRIAAEVGSYKWLAAIARENDGGPAARVHFGVRAQAVWAIMADEGLIDPIEEGVTPSCPYGLLCWDAVEDNPNGRFGIRIEQLALFLIAAQEARLSALEALITEGE